MWVVKAAESVMQSFYSILMKVIFIFIETAWWSWISRRAKINFVRPYIEVNIRVICMKDEHAASFF